MQSRIQNPKSKISTVAIVGVGMMGGSLALALRERGLALRVVGVDRNADALNAAQSSGAIDAGTADLGAGVAEADLIVFATPVPVMLEQFREIAPFVRPDALITDLGSVKGRIVAAGKALFGPRFVGGHPMAGSERSGFAAAKADLFEGAAWAIVRAAPFAFETDESARTLAEFTASLGANPIALDAERHDRTVALVSHLPHLLSFAFSGLIEGSPDAELARRMAGGSYRDIMRVSAADRELWRGIFHENRAALRDALTEWRAHLDALETALLPEVSPE